MKIVKVKNYSIEHLKESGFVIIYDVNTKNSASYDINRNYAYDPNSILISYQMVTQDDTGNLVLNFTMVDYTNVTILIEIK